MRTIHIAWLFPLLGLIAASCSEENPPRDAGPVTLLLRVETGSAHGVAAERSGPAVPGGDGESEIDKLKIFAFDSTTGALEQYASVTITGGTSPDPMWDAARGMLRMVLTPGAKRIYCIANWADNPAMGMPTLNDATIRDTTALTAALRTHGTLPGNPPVMSARLVTTLSGAEELQTVKPERQTARVEIFPMLSAEMKAMGATVRLKGVKFQSVANSTYLFRKYPLAGPASIAPWNQAAPAGAAAPHIVNETSKALAARYDKPYYIPEHITTEKEKATRIILETEYNGEAPIYYTLPVNPTGDAHHSIYTIERNHNYRVYVTIRGKGATTLPTAARSADEGLHNLTCELEIQ